MISWSEIAAECGDYRSGFIAVFQSHEGEETDERDKYGRVVKVTSNSFARHMGIPRQTFQEWLKQEMRTAAGSISVRQRDPRGARAVKEMAREDPSALIDAIEKAGPRAMDDVHHELKLRRAGVDTSRSARKAADAFAHHQTDAIRRAMATAEVPLCVAALHEAADHFRAAISEGAIDDDAMAQIRAALEDVQILVAEADFQAS